MTVFKSIRLLRVLSLACLVPCLVLAGFAFPGRVSAAEVTFQWEPNREEGVQGYRLYYGLQSRSYEDVVDVGSTTRFTLPWLDEDKTYYFAFTAYDRLGNESDFSREIVWSSAIQDPASNERITRNLLVLYKFLEGGGSTVLDVSGNGSPLDLDITDLSAIRWTEDGLSIQSPASIVSQGPAAKIIDAVRKTNELSVEAWITSANGAAGRTARIVGISENPERRNFTLSQEGTLDSPAAYDLRLRSTSTPLDGAASLARTENPVNGVLTHVACTLDSAGTLRIYLDGRETLTRFVGGTLANWAGSMSLTLGSEVEGGSPWLGDLHLVAFYDRALSPLEVLRNFHSGPRDQR